MSQPTLRNSLPGDVLRPGDAGYDDASATVFAKGSPQLVVRPRDASDVCSVVEYAIREDVSLSVRCGGHSMLGSGTNDGGVVLDLSALDAVEVVDADRRLVRAGGGATWGQVADALAPYGLGLTAGDTSGVGVGGLTLGGGVGWMVRKHGLAIDQLVGARIVTADGHVLEASETQNTELFWAIRGGGGNFGVVLDFDFIAHPVRTVRFGLISYDVDDPRRLVTGWRDHMRTAPDELTTTCTLMPSMFGMPASAMVMVSYVGEEAEADAAIRPLTELGTVTANTVAPMPYAEVLEDAHPPADLRMIGRNTLLPELDDELIEKIVAAYEGEVPAVLSIRSLGGAYGRVPRTATAYAHRDAEVMVIYGVMLAADAAESDSEVLAPWSPIAHRGTGVYLNFQGSATEEDLAAAYPVETYARLRAVKRRYDPHNLFARNHNVTPTAGDSR